MDEAVQSLMINRCVTRVQQQPEVCSPLSVVGNPHGKLRLVLDLKYLNQVLHVLSFKYEDLRIAALMFEHMFKFNLKSGYHHVNIWPEHYKFLGFHSDKNGEVNYYVFTVLPFGSSTACYLFTKLTRPLIRYWHHRGLKAIIYLDDGIFAVRGRNEAKLESMRVRQDLEKAGFVANVEKCMWEPSYKSRVTGISYRPSSRQIFSTNPKDTHTKIQTG